MTIASFAALEAPNKGETFRNMLPYYHPTTVVALDDEPLFLESFAFHFGEDFVCKTFHRPDDALAFFDNTANFQTNGHDFFATETGLLDSVGTNPADQFIRLDASAMARLMADPRRFRQTSLLVVDYAMPGMNGIEICRRLKAHPAKKVLLTGKASEETAVKAFNEGIIDCFLMKQMPDLPRVLDREMRQLQRQYFADVTAPLTSAYSVQTDGLFSHEAFGAYFRDLYEARNVVEYYYQPDRSGIVMVTDKEEALFLLVLNEDAVVSGIEIARDQGACDELIRILDSRKVIPMFPGADATYTPRVTDNWHNHLWPAHVFEGDTPLYCSLITEDDLPPETTKHLHKFATFQNDPNAD